MKSRNVTSFDLKKGKHEEEFNGSCNLGRGRRGREREKGKEREGGGGSGRESFSSKEFNSLFSNYS
ncbi:MAG: hypothetical protein MJE68_02715 [Proteobacteria bacterium]|nr:hypothetical protein [Pseudomonadota bacterium]